MKAVIFPRLLLWAGVVLCVLLFLPGISAAQAFYNSGDANADGWCNWADVWAMRDFFRGWACPDFCPAGADANGNGFFQGSDVTYLVDFLQGGGPAPVGLCACPLASCDPAATAQIELRPIQDGDPSTATFTVTIMTAVAVSGFNFSMAYDPAVIAGIDAIDEIAPVYFSATRPFLPGEAITAITFDSWANGPGTAYPIMTDVFDLVLTAAAGAPNVILNLGLDDPIFGPPRFYEGDGVNYSACQPIFPTCTYQPVGDVNGNGAANGIDVTFFVTYLKGGNPLVGRYFWNLPVVWNY
ncbi:MAG: hypothetical protein A2W25_13325 [candidate division Zixibacteria bacterium RBG_16_53_22]|nr:MAG: hypothetical protein A2W25_13325 [candidate division Zixibacteria bacterium RBG_16_53_22]